MHELTFVNQVTQWINEILLCRLDLPFSNASIEESSAGQRKRRWTMIGAYCYRLTGIAYANR